MAKEVSKRKMQRAYGKNLVYVPDGTMQIFKWVTERTSYSTRVEGWACDYYEFDDLCISEGYDPAGKRAMCYEECQPFRKAADDLYDRYIRSEITSEERVKMLQNLLDDFVGTIKGKLERKEIK